MGKFVENVLAAALSDQGAKLDALEQDIKRRQSVVKELDKHEVDARKELERLYAEIAHAGQTLKQAEDEVETYKSTAHGHADQIRAEARAEAIEVRAEAVKERDRMLGDASKSRDALANEVVQKKQELKATMAALDAAKTAISVIKQQARKFADG